MKRRIYDQEGHAQFVTFSCFHRRRLLDHPQMRDMFVATLSEKLSASKSSCCGYVVMPDHVHAIVWFPEPNNLSVFMKAWKQTSSLRLKKLARGIMPNYLESISAGDPFWQAKYYSFSLYSESKAREKLYYMHLNPVRAGLVERAVDWRWSSARYYELGESGEVPLAWVFYQCLGLGYLLSLRGPDTFRLSV